MLVLETHESGITTIALNDSPRRNALSLAMFDALDAAIGRVARDESTIALVLRGEGAAFCAGFDLGACVEDAGLLPTFIRRLSALNRSLRRLPQVVIASVHGAAIAGGCAMLSACDFVVVAPDATLGYPVHAIGISPAVTIPSLRLALGDGAARSLLMSGDLINGQEAFRRGLATHLAQSAASAHEESHALAQSLTKKGAHALRVTKAWLNELDGSLRDSHFDAAAEHSAIAAGENESKSMLQAFWARRRA